LENAEIKGAAKMLASFFSRRLRRSALRRTEIFCLAGYKNVLSLQSETCRPDFGHQNKTPKAANHHEKTSPPVRHQACPPGIE
jgi:hypothetical protein